jgi:hypothetical protein
MFLAPLNYDRFFERVFSDVEVAKHFLQDFLDITIEEITPLPRKQQLTDDAAFVEFDYRAKVNGEYIILDMQQWYKTDVVQRFHLYACLNTALQLENLETISIPFNPKRDYKTKNYRQVAPTQTIVWMAHDTLGFKEDFVAFSSQPEAVAAFVRDSTLWQNLEDPTKLLVARENVLKLLNNDKKNLSFLSQNRLIFAFQPNIVRNAKMTKYLAWFEFAERTKNENNKAADFKKFLNHQILPKVMDKLATSTLAHDDFELITDYPAYLKRVEAYDRMKRQEFMEELAPRIKSLEEQLRVTEQARLILERERQIAEQNKQQAEQERLKTELKKQQAEQEKQQAEQELFNTQLHSVKNLLALGFEQEMIGKIIGLNPTELETFLKLATEKGTS